jgi:hypothetical protein
VASDGEAEALLPGLAAYWAKLGLKVDTSSLDNGQADLRAALAGVGGVLVRTYGPDQGAEAVRRVNVSANTDCHQR